MDTAVLHRFDRVGDLDQLAGCFFRVSIGAGGGKFHRLFLMPHAVKHRPFHADHAIRECAVIVIYVPIVEHRENDEQSN
jgi:hypothetical protein